jgi:hypothetical protein
VYPVYVRGEAYLGAGQGSAAAAEFQKLIDHRGITWSCTTGALAHFGLGRAYTLQAKPPKHGRRIRASSPSGKTPTPTSPSCKKPRRSTRSCSDFRRSVDLPYEYS